jgi:hypothetical protein
VCCHCRVLESNAIEEANHCQVDQTVRAALGIPALLAAPEKGNLDKNTKYPELYIYPLRRKIVDMVADSFAVYFGRRYLFFRAKVAGVGDMEKQIARAGRHFFSLLGITESGELVGETCFPKWSRWRATIVSFHTQRQTIRLYEADDEFVSNRKRFEKEADPGAKFVDLMSKDNFGGGYVPLNADGTDIPGIYLDAEFRMVANRGWSALEPTSENIVIFPLRVRRAIPDRVWREAREFGLTLAVTAFAAINVFLEHQDRITIGLMSVILLALVFWLVLMRLRSEVA